MRDGSNFYVYLEKFVQFSELLIQTLPHNYWVKLVLGVIKRWNRRDTTHVRVRYTQSREQKHTHSRPKLILSRIHICAPAECINIQRPRLGAHRRGANHFWLYSCLRVCCVFQRRSVTRRLRRRYMYMCASNKPRRRSWKAVQYDHNQECVLWAHIIHNIYGVCLWRILFCLCKVNRFPGVGVCALRGKIMPQESRPLNFRSTQQSI